LITIASRKYQLLQHLRLEKFIERALAWRKNG